MRKEQRRFVRIAKVHVDMFIPSLAGIQLVQVNLHGEFTDESVLIETLLTEEQQEILITAGAIVFPSLTAPADKLQLATQSWLNLQGVRLQPGDMVLNVLRRLRDLQGWRFDLSLPD